MIPGMRMIFVRHGVPEEADWMMKYGKIDFDRPLTRIGAHEMQQVAKGLKKIVESVSTIVASPLVRAQQTASILAEEFLISVVHTEDALSHEYAPSETLSALARVSGETILCVGHQPNISSTISLALNGSSDPMIDMGRGSVCGVYFTRHCNPGEGRLLFHLPRKVFLS